MKGRNGVLVLLGVAALQSAAMAEMITGTISSIDPQAKTLTLIRADDQQMLTVSVQNENQLSGLQPGGQVTVEAGRGLFGGWKADNVVTAQEAGAAAGATPAPEAAAADPVPPGEERGV